MSNKRNLLFVLITVLSIVIFVIICIMVINIKSNNLLKKAEKIYRADNTNIIYIGRETCGYCQMFTPVIDDLKEKFNLDYFYLDTDKLTNKDLKKILTTFDIDLETFGTPYLVITKNGKIIDTQSGYTDELSLFFIMQEAGIIDKDILNPYIVSDNNEVIKNFNEVFNSDERKLIYFGRPNCKYCQLLSPIMEEVKKEKNIDYYYIDTNKISGLELSTIIYKLGKRMDDFGTPYLIVTQNGKVIDEQKGYVEKIQLVEFLKKVELIK